MSVFTSGDLYTIMTNIIYILIKYVKLVLHSCKTSTLYLS
jgi:hypothetical protein